MAFPRLTRFAVVTAALASMLHAGSSSAQTVVRINPDNGSNLLPAGHALVAEHNYVLAELDSVNGRFKLYLSRGGFLQLDNQVNTPRGAGAGYPIWGRQDGRAPDVRVTVLRMQKDGDLVLRGDGRRIWSSGTAGTGDHNYAEVLDRGALVVRTSTGRTVWSSRTTAVEMTVGDRLASGRTLVNRTGVSTTRLVMRRSGDLALERGSRTVWTSGTHTRGSTLLVTRFGRVIVQAPSGSALWQSRAVGSQPVFTVAQDGRLTLGNEYHSRRCWQRPRHTGGCGKG